jgi:hypothetical protein
MTPSPATKEPADWDHIASFAYVSVGYFWIFCCQVKFDSPLANSPEKQIKLADSLGIENILNFFYMPHSEGMHPSTICLQNPFLSLWQEKLQI